MALGVVLLGTLLFPNVRIIPTALHTQSLKIRRGSMKYAIDDVVNENTSTTKQYN